MSKKETCFQLIILLLALNLSANEKITLGQIIGIKNNSDIRILNNNIPVQCEPHGIKTLEWMIRDAAAPAECQKSVDIFYTSHPHEKRYAQEHLHLYQRYHYEKSDKGCVLYANGPESYSEMLLNNGLATVNEKYDVREWNEKLKRAFIRGQKQKAGIHDTDIIARCIEKKR